jgi:hypothetical protein
MSFMEPIKAAPGAGILANLLRKISEAQERWIFPALS